MIKPIPNFPGYFADRQGNIWSTKVSPIPRRLKLYEHFRDGYLIVTLRREKKQYSRCVHTLILETFVGPCPEGMECCHNNGDILKNEVSNLRWGTHKSNMEDKVKHGNAVSSGLKGEEHGRSKLTEFEVLKIKGLLEEGQLFQDQIAEIFNVTAANVSHINTKRSWRHLK